MVSKYEITIGGKKYVVEVGDVSASPVEVIVNGQSKTVAFSEIAATPFATVEQQIAEPTAAPTAEPEPTPKPEPEPQPEVETTPAGAVAGAGEAIKAPMPGKILSVTANLGDAISEGDTVCTLEAMKMEMPISSTTTGTVKGIHVSVGDSVAYDDPLVTIG